MTLSTAKIFLLFGLSLSLAPVLAASPPDAEMAASAAALANAERAQPRGPAADVFATARGRYAQAQDAMTRKKYRDALRLAEEARAIADLAAAKARRVNAQIEVDEKAARNADLRRQLLIVPENGP